MSFDRASTAKNLKLFQFFTVLAVKKVHILNHFFIFQLPAMAAWYGFHCEYEITYELLNYL